MATFKDIQLLRTTYLRGPSVWTYRPVLEVWLDLGELEDYPSNKIDGFTERLTACCLGWWSITVAWATVAALLSACRKARGAAM